MRGNNKQNYLFNISLFYPLDNEQCFLNLSRIKTSHIPCDRFLYVIRLRTSVTLPLIAAAATIAGLINNVRPDDEP
jgi:hypothetical protein